LSHVCFLILLAAATFRLDQGSKTITVPPHSTVGADAAAAASGVPNSSADVGVWNVSTGQFHLSSSLPSSWSSPIVAASTMMLSANSNDTWNDEVETALKEGLRPANILMTNVQICLMFWILGRSSQKQL
jgi:hypothetical protein